jgi:hypothetical protein
VHPRQGSLQEESPSFGEAESMGDEKDVVPPHSFQDLSFSCVRQTERITSLDCQHSLFREKRIDLRSLDSGCGFCSG